MNKFFRFNKSLLFLFVFAALFIYSNQAYAFFDVIPALASMQLSALDFIDSIIASLFVLLIIALAGGFFITFSAKFLDWASSLPMNLDNSLVNAGWGFLSGFANVIFILIFIAIALAYIFKKDTWGMQKALPRLIVVAFLVNFSMLFVKMFVDVGWIAQNSMKTMLSGTSGMGMAAPIALQVADSIKSAVAQYGTWFFASYFVAALIPFVNVAKGIWLATAILNEGLFGTFSETFILAAFGIIGGLVFFAYGVLFLLRIAVIWLLAMAAPLAFAAYILPQTQKFFSQWLKALFEWIFLGIVVFFLMGLGLKLFGAVAPLSPFEVRGTHLIAEYSKFIFLIIYLVLVFNVAKKFTPAAGQFIWKAVEKGGMAAGAVGGIAALKGAFGATKTFKTGAGAARNAYTQARSQMNMPRGQALRWAIRRGWTEPGVRSALEPKAVGKGIWGAIKDTAKAGAAAGLGIKLPKKRGLRIKPCDACGFGSIPTEKIAASATECPHCKNILT